MTARQVAFEALMAPGVLQCQQNTVEEVPCCGCQSICVHISAAAPTAISSMPRGGGATPKSSMMGKSILLGYTISISMTSCEP